MCMKRIVCLGISCIGVIAGLLGTVPVGYAQDIEVSDKTVRQAIDRGKNYLIQNQIKAGASAGSWFAPEHSSYPTGVTSLCTLALLNCGMTAQDPPVQDALRYLRKVREPTTTYEVSLMIMAFAAAKDGNRDQPRLLNLTQKLIRSQVGGNSDNTGGWGYNRSEAPASHTDRSNSQFAILALREAQYAGIPVDRTTWEQAKGYWFDQQAAEGGWNYSGSGGGGVRGSMTVAGITSVVIIDSMLRDPDDEHPDGTPKCCGGEDDNQNLNRGIRWLERNFSVVSNPPGGSELLYYLYGLERAGRLSGRRFIGTHDWYREGAEVLLRMQSRRDFSWTGVGHGETDTLVGTSFALLFLSKGLAPVLINKLEYTSAAPLKEGDEPWNRHRDDVRNLTEFITGLPGWPKLVTWQTLNLKTVVEGGGLTDLLTSPIQFMNGDQAPQLTDAEVELLKEYVLNGGFIFAEAACTKTEFDRGFRELIQRMYPNGEHPFKRLGADHPVFRSEHLLDPDTVELWGVDVGCRTSIIYSPHDIACLWDKWNIVDPPKRSKTMKLAINKATRVGVNIVAYAVGREPPSSLQQAELVALKNPTDHVERGLIQIAKLRHTGGWDVAPHALRNLLFALNAYGGTLATTKDKNLTAVDPQLFQYPLLYLHGRNQFQLTKTEQDKLREYCQNGGLIFADACCGAEPFDRSFRQIAAELFPEHKLERIPANHEIFSSSIGHDLRSIRRREPAGGPGEVQRMNIVVGEPYLEGVKIDDRYVLIYSKYDISCALERQASSACVGYLPEDAVKVAVNIVLYSILQK